MDPIVIQAMAKWPNVPNVFGWLSLARRGTWLIKGDRIANAGVTAFIGRNYAADERGRWFFQNGPQRVFVTLEYTPFVVNTASDASTALETHIGQPLPKISVSPKKASTPLSARARSNALFSGSFLTPWRAKSSPAKLKKVRL